MTTIHSKKEHKKEDLVQQEGHAFQNSYDQLMHEDPHAIIEVDNYIITASFEPAEGMYMIQSDLSLKWITPEKQDNQHMEVIVQDKDDRRFIPYLDVSLVLYSKKEVVFHNQVPFIWHPFVFHYGINGSIPGEGEYIPEVFIKMPTFHRHDEVRGKRYTKDVQVKLGSVHLTPGKKPHGPE